MHANDRAEDVQRRKCVVQKFDSTDPENRVLQIMNSLAVRHAELAE